ncbi:hypothetical protein HZB07_07010 [Candidatus Saganbacteria bacterium]|nr:hypothetical protein [Candidatus Saganbacteria bacterium]
MIEQPMVLVPLEEYEELLEEAEVIVSKSLSKQIQEARKRFKKGLGRPLSASLYAIEIGHRKDIYR